MLIHYERCIRWIGTVNNKNFRRALRDIERKMTKYPGKELTLTITSPGGDAELALAFFDAIKILNPNLTTVALGKMHSSALVIWLAGTRRMISPHTTMWFHPCTEELHGEYRKQDANAHSKHMALLDRFYGNIISKVTKRKLTPRKIKKMELKQVILTPQQAVTYGLAHEVIFYPY